MPVQPLNGLVLILARLLGITDFRGEPKKFMGRPAKKKKKNRFFRIFLLKNLFLLFFYELKTT
jgi:hypothetical protein